MANSIFVAATQRGSGKSAVSLGLVTVLERSLGRVSYFKPIGIPDETGVDPDVQLMKDALGLRFAPQQMAPVTMDQVAEALAGGRYDQLLDSVLDAYQKVAAESDFVVCEGTDYFGAMASFEFDINADLSKNLGAPILLVANARRCEGNGRQEDGCCQSDPCDDMLQNILTVKESFDEKSCDFFGVVINRAPAREADRIRDASLAYLAERGLRPLGTVPCADLLERPRLEEIAAQLRAEVLSGRERLNVTVSDIVVTAMSVNNALGYLERGSVVVVPGDRDDVLLGVAAAYVSPTVNDPSGVVLTGGLNPGANVEKLVRDLTREQMPILKVATNTFETAIAINEVKPHLAAHQRQRVDVVKGLVERYVDVEELVTRSVVGPLVSRITPRRFIHGLVDRARNNRQHIVLPEGTDERILRAAASLTARQVVQLTLLGDEEEIRRQVSGLGLAIDGVDIIDPVSSELREPFARRYMELRGNKAPIFEHAVDLMSDVSYFGTMMVQEGRADGMVSGAAHTTAHTLRPALEFVKTKEGVKIASSVFFMCLPDSVLVYGDCAVNPNPSAEQLADIALASASTASAFGIEPRVAMLSYSTGESGTGSDVELVREATVMVKQRDPRLLVEGPIQYDAAVDANVARKKLPGSKVAGRATVFIFPDLNTGNNTYKAVQRSAGAIAIGPVMQGLRKPVNDLSRGCTVPDIVNTVAITAIQAQRP